MANQKALLLSFSISATKEEVVLSLHFLCEMQACSLHHTGHLEPPLTHGFHKLDVHGYLGALHTRRFLTSLLTAVSRAAKLPNWRGSKRDQNEIENEYGPPSPLATQQQREWLPSSALVKIAACEGREGGSLSWEKYKRIVPPHPVMAMGLPLWLFWVTHVLQHCIESSEPGLHWKTPASWREYRYTFILALYILSA